MLYESAKYDSMADIGNFSSCLVNKKEINMQQIHINELINGLKISDKMKREFINLNYMYYTNYADGKLIQPYLWKISPEYMALDKNAKKNIGINGSIFGYLFSFLSYFFKGMFLKGLIFGLIIIPIAVFMTGAYDSVSTVLCNVIAIFIALNIRKDYFYEKCLKNRQIHQMIKNGLVNFVPDEKYGPIPKK